jgi:hypothetical protein
VWAQPTVERRARTSAAPASGAVLEDAELARLEAVEPVEHELAPAEPWEAPVPAERSTADADASSLEAKAPPDG